MMRVCIGLWCDRENPFYSEVVVVSQNRQYVVDTVVDDSQDRGGGFRWVDKELFEAPNGAEGYRITSKEVT